MPTQINGYLCFAKDSRYVARSTDTVFWNYTSDLGSYNNWKGAVTLSNNTIYALADQGFATSDGGFFWQQKSQANDAFKICKGFRNIYWIRSNKDKGAVSVLGDGFFNDFYTFPAALDWRILKSIYRGGVRRDFVIANNTNKAAISDLETASNPTASINFTAINLPTSDYWTDFASSSTATSDGILIIISSNTTFLKSTDSGVTWTSVTVPAGQWELIDYIGGLFVVIEKGTSNTLRSADGIAWTAANLPWSADWTAFAGGLVISGSIGGSNKGAWTDDGILWKEVDLPDSKNWNSIYLIEGEVGKNYCFCNREEITASLVGDTCITTNDTNTCSVSSRGGYSKNKWGSCPNFCIFNWDGIYGYQLVTDGCTTCSSCSKCEPPITPGDPLVPTSVACPDRINWSGSAITNFYNYSICPTDTITLKVTAQIDDLGNEHPARVFIELINPQTIVTNNGITSILASGVYNYTASAKNPLNLTMTGVVQLDKEGSSDTNIGAIRIYSNSTYQVNKTATHSAYLETNKYGLRQNFTTSITDSCPTGIAKWIVATEAFSGINPSESAYLYLGRGGWQKLCMPFAGFWKLIFHQGTNQFIAYFDNILVFNDLDLKNQGSYSLSPSIQISQSFTDVQILTSFQFQHMQSNGITLVGVNASSTYTYSDDGLSWSTGTLPIAQEWDEFYFINNRFVLTKKTAAQPIIYSNDGISWSVANSKGNFLGVLDIDFQGNFCLLGQSPADSTVYSFTSIDLQNWNRSPAPLDATVVAAGKVLLPSDNSILRDGFFALGGINIYVSIDGLVWERIQLDITSPEEWVDVKYIGNGTDFNFLGIAKSGASVLSTNGFSYHVYNHKYSTTDKFYRLTIAKHEVLQTFTPSPSPSNSPTPTPTVTPSPSPSPTMASVLVPLPTLPTGNLWSVGLNVDGGLGDYTDLNRSSPVQIYGGGNTWNYVSEGLFHACGIKSNGTLWCWGANGNGQLGNNSTDATSLPIQVYGGGNDWLRVFCSQTNTYGIKSSGRLFAWGYGLYGMNAVGSTSDRSSPTAIAMSTTNWAFYDFGAFDKLALGVLLTGELYSWGYLGDYGLGSTSSNLIPLRFGSDVDWKNARPGKDFILATKSNDTLYSIGKNDFGQLGNNSTSISLNFGKILDDIKEFACGEQHALALTNSSQIYAWGKNDYGQLGLDDVIHRSLPVLLGGNNWIKVSTFGNTSYAIKSDGSAWSWGQEQYGNLGENQQVHRSSPVQLTGNDSQIWYHVSGNFYSAGLLGNGKPTPSPSASPSPTPSPTPTPTPSGTGSTPSPTPSFSNSPTPSPSYSRTPTPTPTNTPTPSACGATPDPTRSPTPTPTATDIGQLYLWGSNVKGQLAQNNTIDYPVPMEVLSDGKNWIQIESGYAHFVALKNDGSLWNWGYNYFGEVGDDTIKDKSSPVQTVYDEAYWISIACGKYHTAGIELPLGDYNELRAWGGNPYGHFGNNTTLVPLAQDAFSPIDAYTNISHVAQIAVRNDTSAVLGQDMRLWMAGRNDYGQLGIGNTANYSVPVNVNSGGVGWKSVSVGNNFAAAIKLDNSLWVWGYNGDDIDPLQPKGMLGDETYVSKSFPVQTISATKDWFAVDCGYLHTAAIKTDGSLWLWGHNSYGCLGIDNLNHTSSPIQTITLGNNWSQVSCGAYHTGAIKNDSSLWMWGLNILNDGTEIGCIGDDSVENRSSPVQTITFGYDWKQVSCGTLHTAAIKTDGSLWLWGYNITGNLGDGTLTSRSSPVQTTLQGNDWTYVSAGAGFTAAIKSDSSLWTWGNSTRGQLGVGKTGSFYSTSPVRVIACGNSWSLVNARSYSVIAAKNNNDFCPTATPYGSDPPTPTPTLRPTNLYGWGWNQYGQIALNSVTSKSVPTQCYTEDYVWTQIEAGGNFSGGIKNDNSMWLWGQNEAGQLGTGDTVHRSSPIQTVGIGTWSQMALGERHAVGIRTDGTLWTWGYNLYGQLGTGDIYDRSSPTQTTMYGSVWTTVACGEDHTLAIDNLNQLWAWGFNSYGQLGDNTYAHRSSPVQTIIAGTDWFRVACGSRFSAAIKNDFSLWLWGRNNFGQLGNTTTNSFPVPQREFLNFNDWEFVSCGNHHAVAIRSNGVLYVWGGNDIGQLGTNTTKNLLLPVPLLPYTWTQVSCGKFTTAAIRQDGTLWNWGFNYAGNLGNANGYSTSSPVQTFRLKKDWAKITYGNYHAHALIGNVTPSPTPTSTQPTPSPSISPTSTPTPSLSATSTPTPTLSPTFTPTPSMSISPTPTPTQSPTASGATNTPTPSATPTPSPTPEPTLLFGQLFMTGNNDYGQLGLNDKTNRNNIEEIYGDGKTWFKVENGGNHAGGIKKDGSLWVWGGNSYGQLGDDTRIAKSSPIQIKPRNFSTYKNVWHSAAFGKSHSAGIQIPEPTVTPVPAPTPIIKGNCGLVPNQETDINLQYGHGCVNQNIFPSCNQRVGGGKSKVGFGDGGGECRFVWNYYEWIEVFNGCNTCSACAKPLIVGTFAGELRKTYCPIGIAYSGHMYTTEYSFVSCPVGSFEINITSKFACADAKAEFNFVLDNLSTNTIINGVPQVLIAGNYKYEICNGSPFNGIFSPGDAINTSIKSDVNMSSASIVLNLISRTATLPDMFEVSILQDRKGIITENYWNGTEFEYSCPQWFAGRYLLGLGKNQDVYLNFGVGKWQKLQMPSSANWKMIYDYNKKRFIGYQGNEIVSNYIASKPNRQFPHSFLTLDSTWYNPEVLPFNITAMGTDGNILVALSDTDKYAIFDNTKWYYFTGILNKENWNELFWLNGRFIAINSNSSYLIYSDDRGIAWIGVGLPSPFRSLAFQGGIWVAIGVDGHSYKGATLLSFTKSSFGGLTGNCKIAAGKINGTDGFVVLVGNNICTSYDGLNWTQKPMATTNPKDWVDLKYIYDGNSYYWLGVASNGANIYSTDGIKWDIYNYGEHFGSFKQIIYGVYS